MQLESSVTLFDDVKVEDRFAELQITADGITSEVSRKVGNDEVISRINQTAETIKIQADKVNIEGATIFTDGRLSQNSLNNAYDSKGAASSALDDAKNYADSAVSGKANKTDAIARQQRMYYRKTSAGAPSPNTTWLSSSGNGYGNWSLKIPPMTSGTTKYPYLYTAVQTQTVSQMAAGNSCSCSAVLLDDTTTVIDGGTIITGTVNANAVNASSGTFNTANIPSLSSEKITVGSQSLTTALNGKAASGAENTANNYITDIGNDGIRVHDAHTPNNSVVIDSDGMEVFKGGITDAYSVAKYGDTTRIGKTSGKHIEITNTNFNVYDDDGSKPFVVSTASSSTQSTCNRWYYVKANSSLNNQLYFKGTLVDNKVSVGVAASGRPSASTYVTLTNTGTNYTVTVSGVKYTLSRTNGTLTYKIENTNSAQRSCLLQYTQSYKQTYVRENTHLLAPSSQSITIENVTGTCSEIHLYTYGGIAHLWLSVYNGSSIADGGLMYQGKLGDILPVAQCYMTGFTNNAYVKKVAGRISYDGDVYVYNVSGGSLSTTSSNYATLSATYVMKD